ncbi:MAG: metal ABC transporter permease [Anaeromyxobacter sp.]|nr:metal ABC transporter permease [Anaeromyxobacter sp.]MBL0274820.1 metal ABC transporter permease [Anaeromyxobacter sp.]
MSWLGPFLAAREIWQAPLLASLMAGALLGFLGVYVVLRRTVFVSAALTQISTLGLVFGLFLEERLHIEAEHAHHQLGMAMGFAVVGAVLLAALRPRRLPAEALVGAAWVTASALVVLGVSRLVHAAHDLGGMVFGNAVAVPDEELWIIAAVALLCGLVHLAFRKEITFASFDPETARAMGLHTWVWDAALAVTVGLAIPASARALGALPVFAFLTLPASAALLLRLRLGAAFALAAAFGVSAAAGGYLISWFAETPTGATMVAVAALFLVPGGLRALWQDRA